MNHEIFSVPEATAIDENISSHAKMTDDVGSSTKMVVNEKLNPLQKIESSAPVCYFLSSIENVPETWDQSLTLTFSDLLHPSLGVLQESVQFNFMVELGWLLAQYCQHKVQ
jgi:tyrosyl-DNA phosphodiesterase-1